ncbi:prolipoprotein diacylglyceryl transferase [Candidatus Falkowbacteria bacterium]|jgi:phosphatidylglycerol---prolipoprotein diacylglyceryl transferase|nr:prolipoprotein diacylglyceryl transferase [Candidatus Falkowbacteria bacterium]MBT7007642.1 prolipoprotein diacylglyceryl transferase [Candidatus Falkowbacteria bacterium]
MFNFFHNYIPQSILFSVGPFEIHWYAFLMVIGGLIGYFIVLKLAKLYQVDKKVIEALLIWFSVGAVIGARIYYVLYSWSFYQDNLLDIFKIWNGGLAVHGVMIGGFIATLLMCKVKRINFWKIADLAVIGLVSAQVFGRIGNYFNQEIFGKPTDLPWGIPIESLNRPAEYLNSEYFHPTFIYESLGNLVIFDLLLFFFLRFVKGQMSNVKGGSVFLSYLILYSILRFSLEFLRTDSSPELFGIRWAQLFSVVIIMSGMVFLFARHFRKNDS